MVLIWILFLIFLDQLSIFIIYQGDLNDIYMKRHAKYSFLIIHRQVSRSPSELEVALGIIKGLSRTLLGRDGMVAASKQLLLLEVFQEISFDFMHLMTHHGHFIFYFPAQDVTPDSSFCQEAVWQMRRMHFFPSPLLEILVCCWI